MGIGTMTRVKNEKGSVCERYARDTHPELMQLADERLFCSGCRQRNTSAANQVGGVTECHFSATKQNMARRRSMPRTQNSPRTVRDRGFATEKPHAKTIAATHHDECLMRVQYPWA